MLSAYRFTLINMKPIVQTPNQVLITVAKPVAKIDKKITSIIADMTATLKAADNPKGVGLAAPQIGVSLRIFLIRPEEDDPIRVIINPTIVEKSSHITKGIPYRKKHLEGCLSIPHIWGMVKRHTSLTLQFMDENGQKHEEIFEEFPAIIVQHEIDHLDGILFTRRVIEQKGQLFKPSIDKNGEEILEPLDI